MTLPHIIESSRKKKKNISKSDPELSQYGGEVVASRSDEKRREKRIMVGNYRHRHTIESQIKILISLLISMLFSTFFLYVFRWNRQIRFLCSRPSPKTTCVHHIYRVRVLLQK